MGDERIAALDGVSLRDRRAARWSRSSARRARGKSTLLNILGCLDTPSRGRVPARRARRPGPVRRRSRARAQSPDRLRVPELPAAAPRDRAEERRAAAACTAACRRASASDARAEGARARRARAPHRATSRIQLSGGQRQRTAIARALVTEPSLLLCDEPTGNLDSATTEDIMALFHALHDEGNTILIVTHEPEIAARCPRAIRIFDGKIVGWQGQRRRVRARRARREGARWCAGAARGVPRRGRRSRRRARSARTARGRRAAISRSRASSPASCARRARSI